MSAAKSGNHIYVSGSGNTLASITSDINDTTFIEKTSTSPDVYTVKGGVARYLRIRNGGTLIIGDSCDYSKNETLAFSNDVANELRFYVDAGGRLEQYGDTTIDFFTGTQRIYYLYIYGALYIRGNATYKPVWQNYQRIYLYEQQNNNTYVNDIWDIDGMIIGSGAVVNYYAFYFNSFGKVRNHIFKNITFDKSYGKNLSMYCFRFPYDINGVGNITFENINFYNTGNYPLYTTGARPHLKDCEWHTCTNWNCLNYGTGNTTSMNTVRSYGLNNECDFGQKFTYLEGCTFGVEAYVSKVLCQYNGIFLLKDCEWQHTTGDSVQCAYGGVVMMWSGNTFTGGREYYGVDFDGAIQWVYGLNLTVEDKFGNAIEGAKVYIEQSEAKEKLMFLTKSTGKLDNSHSLEVALLTWKHQYGNSKTTDMEYWSDSSNSTYHTITVFKEGYEPVSFNLVMDEDKSQTVILMEISNLKVEV